MLTEKNIIGLEKKGFLMYSCHSLALHMILCYRIRNSYYKK